MTNNNSSVPTIRFKGFVDDWTQRKLGEVVKVNSGRDYKHLNQGDIPVYGTGGYMLSVDESLSDEDAVGIGRKGTIDKPQFLKAPFWTVDTLFFMTPKPSNELRFLLALSQGIEWAKLDESTGVPSLSKVNIENVLKFVPNFYEQIAIGTFFRNLDDIIHATQRKVAGLKQLKAAYLQQMFPQAGEKVPRMRFEGFSEEWSEKRIGDIFDVTRGQVLAATKVSAKRDSENIYPVYSSQTKNNGLLGYYNDFLFDTAITWTTDGANAGTVNFREGKFYSTNVNGVLLSQEGYANRCTAEALNMMAWRYVSKVGNSKLMNNIMSEIKIMIPPLNEQIAIGDFFYNLDTQIEAQSKKIKKLRWLKVAYLQKMFV